MQLECLKKNYGILFLSTNMQNFNVDCKHDGHATETLVLSAGTYRMMRFFSLTRFVQSNQNKTQGLLASFARIANQKFKDFSQFWASFLMTLEVICQGKILKLPFLYISILPHRFSKCIATVIRSSKSLITQLINLIKAKKKKITPRGSQIFFNLFVLQHLCR